MKVLFLSNFYPPYARGGMGRSCKSVVEGLERRGHQVRVLTSRYGVKQKRVDGYVIRHLYLETAIAPVRNFVNFFIFRKRHRKSNQAVFRRVLDEFQPDVVFIWGMWNLHRVVALDAEDLMGGSVLYRFGDYWPTLPSQFVVYWRGQSKNLFLRTVKTVVRPLAEFYLRREDEVHLNFPFSYCISKKVKSSLLENGVPIDNADVIYNGIDLEPFLTLKSAWPFEKPNATRLLYVGRVVENKGVHVIMQALAHLRQRDANQAWHLTVAGQGKGEYLSTLMGLVSENDLNDTVHLMGQLDPIEIPILMANHDVLLVPSVWEEPFGRVVIEGMAAKRVVVASQVGGIPEVIDHNSTGILVPPDDAKALADALVSIKNDTAEARSIAENGYRRAVETFGLNRMLDKVESKLLSVASLPQ